MEERKREIQQIAWIKSDFTQKFGIPRQSGLVQSLKSQVIFAPEYRNEEALRGLEDFSHVWLIWEFSAARQERWSPTVRPPRLGGNKRMGVFATRAPFRPNPIGLSAVRLERIEYQTPQGPILHIAGGDLMNGTPIYDIKPYLPYADCIPEAVGGFAPASPGDHLEVAADEAVLAAMPKDRRQALLQVLACDPRPRYQEDSQRIYGMEFAGKNVRFRVDGNCLTVLEIQ